MAYDIAANLQHPDILGAYLRGQQGAIQTQNMQQQGVLNQQAIQQGQFAQQEQPLKLEQLKIALQAQQMKQQAAQQFLQGSQGGAQAAPSSTGGPGIQSAQTAPQVAPGAPQAQPVQSPLDALADPSRLASMAQYGQFNAMMSGGDPIKPVIDAQNAHAAAVKDQQERAKLALQPTVDELQSLITSPAPERLIMANPSYMQGWQRYAPKLGLDPADPKNMTPENVRAAATLAHNDLAGQSMGGIAPLPMPNRLQDVNGTLGSKMQRDPITGKLTEVQGREPLKDVIDPATGLPTNMRASAAEGKQPFNQSVFGASNMSDQALQFAADTYRTTGKMPTGMGRNPAMQEKVLEKVAGDAAVAGDTAGYIAARAAALKANGMALDQNTKLETSSSGYFATLDKNLSNLEQAYSKVDSSGSPLINKAVRAWQQGVSGDKDTASMVVWLNAVQGEYAKLKSGNLGNAPASDSAMKDAKEVINKYMNDGGIQAVAQAMREEGHNRISAIQEQTTALRQNMRGGAPSAGSPAAAPSGGKKLVYDPATGTFK